MENEPIILVLAALFAISELLSLIPSVKSNGVFQLLYNLLRTASGKGRIQ